MRNFVAMHSFCMALSELRSQVGGSDAAGEHVIRFCCIEVGIQNLRNGFSRLSVAVPRCLRLTTAWPQIARAI
jgi:hypothetical protein